MFFAKRWNIAILTAGLLCVLLTLFPGLHKVAAKKRQAEELQVQTVPSAIPVTAYRSPGARHKIQVSDPHLANLIASQKGKLVADYGAFSVFEVDEASLHQIENQKGVSLADESNLLLLNARPIDTSTSEGQLLRRQAVSDGSSHGMHLVQFAGPIQPEWLAALEKTGVQVVSYIPNNAYLVFGDAASLRDVQKLAATSPKVQWDGPYDRALRIQPGWEAASLDGKSLGTEHLTNEKDANLFIVQLFANRSTNAQTLKLIEQNRLEPIRNQIAISHYLNLYVKLNPASLKLIAGQPDVVSITPYKPPVLLDERQGQILANNLTSGVPNPTPDYATFLANAGFTQAQFDASNFVVDLSDQGLDNGTTSPNHFGLFKGGVRPGTSRVAYNLLYGTGVANDMTGCGSIGHGSWTTHVLAGNTLSQTTAFPHGDNSFRHGTGINPFVRVGNSTIFDTAGGYLNPNFVALQNAAYQNGARISSNSWGDDVSNGTYDADAQTFDTLARDAQGGVPGNQEMVMVFAAGNSGPGAGTMSSPGTGKNVLTAGGCQNVRPSVSDATNADNMYVSSSRGPCQDGRKKPDILAPATNVTGGVVQVANPPVNGDADSCYTGSFFPSGQEWTRTGNGTSFACPAVAGGASLLRQHFINRGMAPPSPSMTKAFLMSTATYMTGSGAGGNLWSNDQGMGRMNLAAAFDTMPRVLHDQVGAETLTASGQTRVITGTVSNPAQPFRVTLAWTDAPGSTTGSAFNNNLDLQVTVGGNTYLGNVFSGATSATGGSADTRNNVESVFLPAGVSGNFVVIITATNINSDGVPNSGGALDQDFSLVVYNGQEAAVPVVSKNNATLTAQNCAPVGTTIDPGETVTVDFDLRNIGTAATTNLVATLQTSGNVTAPSAAQTYGAVAPNSTVTRSFTFTANPNAVCGAALVATLQLQDGAANLGTVSYSFNLGTLSTPVTSTASSGGIGVAIPDNTTVNSPITITETGQIQDVNVKIRLNHTYDADLDISLVAPDGTTIDLSSDNGGSSDNFGSGSNDCSGTFTVFDDQASTDVTAGSAPFAGSFRPEQALATLNGKSVTGTWMLRITDDATTDTGTLFCWQLEITRASYSCCTGAANNPTITGFAPIATFPGKTITVTGTGFVAGSTQVFFGGTNLIASPTVTVVNGTTLTAVVPASGTLTQNINGYLTVRVNGLDATSQGLPSNAGTPCSGTATFPEVVLLGDTTGDGLSTQTNDVALARGFSQFQATPSARQLLATDVIPLNGNCRGDGVLGATDIAFLRAVSFGQTTF
ncbi:MAG: S8 family serine peptidase [Blastocatellia bacterium]|nr:S8 family serine peptidase [Blastocatellia bacterium]